MADALSPRGRVVPIPDAPVQDCEVVSHLTVMEQLYTRMFPWTVRHLWARVSLREGTYTIRVHYQ